MGITKEQVESSLKSRLNPSYLTLINFDIGFRPYTSTVESVNSFENMRESHDVIDTSGGCGASFAIEIVSEEFEGKSLLARHRLVNGALQEEMKEIHALSVKKALTPVQWKKQAEPQPSKSSV